jgi:hypothetical protein
MKRMDTKRTKAVIQVLIHREEITDGCEQLVIDAANTERLWIDTSFKSMEEATRNFRHETFREVTIHA